MNESNKQKVYTKGGDDRKVYLKGGDDMPVYGRDGAMVALDRLYKENSEGLKRLADG